MQAGYTMTRIIGKSRLFMWKSAW
ncbi:hypothetical protein RCCS2_01274 [Roseobacter sp. CCS2]|nr:hypothetical protein RCCS2_01274 [Roseobacter sp. CCS2]